MVNEQTTTPDLKEALRAKKVKFSANTRRPKLIALAQEAGIWENLTRSIVPREYKAKYGKDATCGDEIAALLRGADINVVGRQNKIAVGSRWKGLNPGQIRMNLGNVLRGRLRNGEFVVIGDREFNPVERRRSA